MLCACLRLNGSLPDIGFFVPGLDPKQYPYLGLGGDLYSDLCKYWSAGIMLHGIKLELARLCARSHYHHI